MTFVIYGEAVSQVYYPAQYFIKGRVVDPDSVGTDGLWIVFCQKIENNAVVGGYADDYVGTSGLARTPNQYILNAFEDDRLPIKPGKFYIASVQRADGYGCNPVEVTVTGLGYDIAPDLTLVRGGGILPPTPRPTPGEEAVPAIRIWFGNRLYQPEIYGRKEDSKQPFVVSETGKIKIEVNVDDPYRLEALASYAMSVKDPQGEEKAFNLQQVPGFKVQAAEAKPLIVESPYPESLKAEKDEEAAYTFTFNARSRGDIGVPTVSSAQAVVYVMGGPLTLIGIPIVYPSPVHLKTDRKVSFQYILSRDAAVDLAMVDIAARTVKKIAAKEGGEGGSAGLNKVEWDLVTDQGTRLDSGIYIFTIVHEGKLLGKGKLTALP